MPHKKAKKSVRLAATAAQGYDNPPTSTDSLAVASTSSSSTPVSVGVLAPLPKVKTKKLLPKDKLNAFGGRKDMGGLSKTVHRILNAVSVREEYHESKKRKREEEDKATLQKRNNQKTLVPLPYESLPAFNRRVEIALRPTIDTAIRGAKASKKLAADKAKKAYKAKKAALADPSLVADAAVANKGKGKATAETSVDPLVPRAKVRNGRTEFAEASQVRSITDVAMAPPTLKKARRGAAPNASTNAPMPAGRMPVSDGLKKIMELEREKAVRMYREMKEKRDKEQREA